MEINITSLKLERTSEDCIRIAMTQEKGNYTEYATFFCVSKTEWPQVRACALGIAEVYPYFDDCTYLLKFFPSGMRVAYTSGREMDYFTFPCNEIVGTIDLMFDHPEVLDTMSILGDDPKHQDLTPFIPEWKKQYGPNVEVEITDEVKERMLKDIVSPLLKIPGKNLIDDLTQWAGTYSNGNLIRVGISFDSPYEAEHFPDQPTSYYWYFWEVDQQVRIYNGGYIAHDISKECDGSLFEYSMHT